MELIISQSPSITVASNTFINVPVILRYKGLNLIEVVTELQTDYQLQIPIYHPDGTQLAVAKNSRIFLTEAGKKANIKIDKYSGLWVCKMDNKELFEIRQEGANTFKTTAELYTNDGFFVKLNDNLPVNLFRINDSELVVGGCRIYGNVYSNLDVGISIDEDGSIRMG